MSTLIHHNGRLPTTQHRAVLDLLSARAWSKDHPCPASTPGSLGEPTFAQMREEEEALRGMNEDILWVHGDPPSKKPDGVYCLVYENVNGLPNRMGGNNKLYRLRELFDTLQVNIAGMNKHQVNLGHKSNINGFRKMFQGGKTDLHMVAAHNTHENISRIQEGGMALFTGWAVGGDVFRWLKWHKNQSGVRLQPMPQSQIEFAHLLPATTMILD